MLWIPYILNQILVQGVVDAVGYPKDPKPLAPWAMRMQAAHKNAVENLVVFVVLVLVAKVMGISSEVTVLTCVIYFWARVVHAVVYAFRIPFIRTLAFTVRFACQVAIAFEILK